MAERPEFQRQGGARPCAEGAEPQHTARRTPRAAADGEGGGPALAWLVAPRVCPYYSHLS